MFEKAPIPDKKALPELLTNIVKIKGKTYLAREIPVSALLAVSLLPDSGLPNETATKISQIMKENPALMADKINSMSKNDFRDFVKQMVSGQRENISDSLSRLAQNQQDKEYQKAMLDWAKFAYGTEQKVDVNVEVEQKRSFMKQISKQYGYSNAIPTEFEEIPEIDKMNRQKQFLPEQIGHSKDFDQPVPEPVIRHAEPEEDE